MESDDEVKGDGNSFTTEFRQYDPRLGKWLTIDPLSNKEPGWSPYRFCFDNPIIHTDPDGRYEKRSEAMKAKRAAKRAGLQTERIQGKKGSYHFNARDKDGYNAVTYLNRTNFDSYGKSSENNSIMSGFFARDGGNRASANPWRDEIAFHPEWEQTRAKVTNIEKGMETYLYTMASLPLAGSNSLLVNGASNYLGQLVSIKNGGEIDVASALISVIGSKYLPNPWVSTGITTMTDATIDIYGNGNVAIYGLMGDKNKKQLYNDLLFGGISGFSSHQLRGTPSFVPALNNGAWQYINSETSDQLKTNK